MPKLKLLILDANVVIYLHEHELWQAVLERCEVHLSGIVIDDEVRFYPGTEYDEVIDLSPDVDAGRIQRFDVPVSEVKVFRDQFDPVYRGDLDPGEEESLAHMLHAAKDFLISSGDAIVYRILGNVNRGDAGISLEEVLQKVGLSRGNLPWQYTKAFQERYTRVGQQEAIQGLGRKQSGRWSTLAWQFSRPLRPGSPRRMNQADLIPVMAATTPELAQDDLVGRRRPWPRPLAARRMTRAILQRPPLVNRNSSFDGCGEIPIMARG